MCRLMLFSELFVATVFFTIINAETVSKLLAMPPMPFFLLNPLLFLKTSKYLLTTMMKNYPINQNERLGHTISSNFRQHLQVNTDRRSLESDGPFLTGKIDTETILPLFDLIRESSPCAESNSSKIGFKSGPCGLFRLTLMIPDIRDINRRFISAGFECQNNHDVLLDSLDSVALCTSDDDSESTLILVVNLNEDNPLLTAIFDDLKKGVQYQISTIVSSTDYYFSFSISKDEEVSMKVDTLVSPTVTQKTIPRIDLNKIHTIVNKSNAIMGELKQSLRNELTRYGGNVSLVLCFICLLSTCNTDIIFVKAQLPT